MIWSVCIVLGSCSQKKEGQLFQGTEPDSRGEWTRRNREDSLVGLGIEGGRQRMQTAETAWTQMLLQGLLPSCVRVLERKTCWQQENPLSPVKYLLQIFCRSCQSQWLTGEEYQTVWQTGTKISQVWTSEVRIYHHWCPHTPPPAPHPPTGLLLEKQEVLAQPLFEDYS